MENQISPETEVAELELEAVIGFNGEASSMSGLNGLGSLGRVVPTGRVNTEWHLGGSVGLWHEPQPKPSTRGQQPTLPSGLTESLARLRPHGVR